MKIEEYKKLVISTENKNYEEIIDRVNKRGIRLLHGTIGASTEAAELLDAIKKHIYYGRDLDIPNIKEEIGDIMFYLFLLIDELDLSFEEILEKNIEKLRIRYPNRFSKEDAINRDIKKEYEVFK